MGRLLFLLVGTVLFVALAWRLGPGTIAATVVQMGWRLVGVAAIYLLYQLARAAALRWCLTGRDAVPFRQVLWIRLSGEAVQFLTFTGPFLAEPTKAWLLRHQGVTTREAFAAVIAEYLLYTFLSAALSIVALTMLMTGFALPAPLRRLAEGLVWAMALFLAISLVAILGRIYLIGAIIERIARLPGLRRRIQPDMEAVHRMEDLLLLVLRDRPAVLLRVLFAEATAQALLVLELAYLLAGLHPEAPRLFAFLVEAGSKFASMAFFFIPTQLGATEATYAALFEILALPAASGFAVAFVRRLRSLIVAGVGLAAMSGALGRRGTTREPRAS
jgi:hypothetical protein